MICGPSDRLRSAGVASEPAQLHAGAPNRLMRLGRQSGLARHRQRWEVLRLALRGRTRPGRLPGARLKRWHSPIASELDGQLPVPEQRLVVAPLVSRPPAAGHNTRPPEPWTHGGPSGAANGATHRRGGAYQMRAGRSVRTCLDALPAPSADSVAATSGPPGGAAVPGFRR